MALSKSYILFAPILFVLVLSTLCAQHPLDQSVFGNRILYFAKTGQTENALQFYRDHVKQTQKHDFELLHHIGLCILEEGLENKDPEIQVLSLFGAGICANERAIELLLEGATHRLPAVQLLSLNLLSKYENRECLEALNRAMASDYLLIRLEAACMLAEKKHHKAVSQIESLMYKVDPELLIYFPPLFASIGDAHSIKILRRLLTSPKEEVRIVAIISVAEKQRDDLLPQLRTLASQHSYAQQEACASALGMFKDEQSVAKLEALARSPHLNVRLAALQALYRIGLTEVRREVETLAAKGELAAIYMLGTMPGCENLLATLLHSPSISVKINAAVALLEHQNTCCLPILEEYLVSDNRGLLFEHTLSVGKGLKAIKLVPMAKRHEEIDPTLVQQSLQLREDILNKAIDLPHAYFIELADRLFLKEQNDLIPTLVSLLEGLQTPEAIALLKKYQQKVGAPLVRNYCNLALYRLKEPGSYENCLKEWIMRERHKEMVHFKPFAKEKPGSYQLTTEETTRLLLETIEALAQSQNEQGIEILLDVIQHGNKKNKYALAGLLIRATQ